MSKNILRPRNNNCYLKQNKKSRIWLALKILGIAAGAGALALLFIFSVIAKDLPDVNSLGAIEIAESTKIYDRTGEILLYDIHGEEKRTVVKWDYIPQIVKDATIVSEDADFYKHSGIDLGGVIRAFLTNIRGGAISQGGSTITQQLIKNTFLTPEKTFTRKIKEAILAIELERRYSKNEILEIYLNQIPYGSNAYGIEAAAQTFFAKNAKDLTLEETALLAALPKAPSYFSPYGSHYNELISRQRYILNRLQFFGYISEEKASIAKGEKLNFAPNRQEIKAPHFVMYVRDYLNNKYGEEFVEKAGLKVITTLDRNLQKAAEDTISEIAPLNEKNFGAGNAALVALDPRTGEILAMVGSRDYYDVENDGNFNVATSPNRQPGSSFKPFAYAVALQKGYTDNTVIFDVPTEFFIDDNCPAVVDFENKYEKCYHPRNFDDKFRGPVTFREALAQSLNLPAVKVLYMAGVQETIDLAHKMGITTLQEKDRYGLSLVLGGGEVKLLDMVSAYGVFAAGGVKNNASAILKIENSKGEMLEDKKQTSEDVLPKEIATVVTSILSDNAARAPIFGEINYLTLPDRPAAAKTGTTQNYRDAWTIGYTPSLVAGVWAGNNDGKEMNRGGGVSAAAPIWNAFMKKALAGKPAEEFETFEKTITGKPILDGFSDGQTMVRVDKISGKLATEFTPPDLIEERVYSGEIHTILHYVNRDDPRGPAPTEPEKDPQHKNWEEGIKNWLISSGGQSTGQNFAPTQYDDIHIPANFPQAAILKPVSGEIIRRNEFLTAEITAWAPLGVAQADFFIDGYFIGSSVSSPHALRVFITSKILADIKNQSDSANHRLRVVVYDKVRNKTEIGIPITFENF